MVNKEKYNLKLESKYSNYLSELPETGMGYQLVKIELFNGKTVENRVVLNSTFLELTVDKEFNNNDIKSIELIKK